MELFALLWQFFCFGLIPAAGNSISDDKVGHSGADKYLGQIQELTGGRACVRKGVNNEIEFVVFCSQRYGTFYRVLQQAIS